MEVTRQQIEPKYEYIIRLSDTEVSDLVDDLCFVLESIAKTKDTYEIDQRQCRIATFRTKMLNELIKQP